MTYVPDNLGERRRADGVSQTASEFFLKYCQHADRETGLTLANVKTCAAAFSMRSDNAQKYDSELIEKGWIRLIEKDNRIYRKVDAGWLPASARNGQGKAENTENERLLNFRKELEKLLNFREFSYILGTSPKFKEKLLNFRNAYKEFIDQHINQQLDQLTDHLRSEDATTADETASGAGTANDSAKDFGDKSENEKNPAKAKPKREKPESTALVKIPDDFAITDEMRAWAQKNTPHVGIEVATAEFFRFWRDIATERNHRTLRGWISTWESRMEVIEKQTLEKNGDQNGNSKSSGHSNGVGKTAQPTARDERAKSIVDEYKRDEERRARVEARRNAA